MGMELSESGEIVKGAIYHPFGREIVSVSASAVLPPLGSGGISGTHGSRYSFAGKEKDRESDVHYFEWRYYDDGSGRFTSVDPVYYEVGITERGKEALLDPEMMHPYVYGRNGPMRYVDPSGESAAGVVAGGAVVVGTVVMSDESMRASAIGVVGLAGMSVLAKLKGKSSQSDTPTATTPGASNSPGVQDFSDQMSTPPANFTPAAGTGGPSPGGGKDPKKKPARTEAKNLNEKLLMEEAKTTGGGTPVKGLNKDGKLQDPLYQTGWEKWQVERRFYNGTRGNVHYMKRINDGKTEQFKFTND